MRLERHRLQIFLKNEAKTRQIYAEFQGTNKRARSGKYHEISEALYTWYNLARKSLVPVNGLMLQEEALEISKRLDHVCQTQARGSNFARNAITIGPRDYIKCELELDCDLYHTFISNFILVCL